MSATRSMTIAVCAVALAAPWATPAAAHVGSPDTWFEGKAGPYPIRVVVRAPGVVPGLAEIGVRVLSGSPRRVTVQLFAWDAGTSGAPPPDVARAVPGDPRLYGVNLWFMVTTSYGVHIRVSGDEGEGTAIVPVQAVASRRLPMDRNLGWTLVALGLFLFSGLVTIVGAAVRDGSLPPGQQPDAARIARARVAMAGSAIVLALGLVGGRAWWNSVDRANAAGIYKPFHVTASIGDSVGTSWVRLTIDDPRWRGREWTPLLADHGKLMHLFLVRDSDLGAIAHLHPVPRDSEHFEARLPPLPAGRYRVYADIVHESGFAQTLSATVDISGAVLDLAISNATRSGAHAAASSSVASDPDDSWFQGEATAESGSIESRFTLDDGAILSWERGSAPLVAGREHPLRFRVTMAGGSPAALEPYLGMMAHAVVTSFDTTVFAHLHPIGTVSMASQMALMMRTPADSIAGSLGRRMSGGHAMGHDNSAAGVLATQFTIPYGFPKAGRYRLWVQVRRNGVVQTATFDAEVKAAASPS